MAAQSDTYTRQEQEKDPAPLLQDNKQGGILQIVHTTQIIEKMDADHTQDTDAPQSIQFPDTPIYELLSYCALASSSNTR